MEISPLLEPFSSLELFDDLLEDGLWHISQGHEGKGTPASIKEAKLETLLCEVM